MSMQDPLADLLTRIRNGQMAGKVDISLPSSTSKLAVTKVLIDEGYLTSYEISGEEAKPVLTIELKYFEGKPVIDTIKRYSRPGLRAFKGTDELPKVNGGLVVAVISTSKGVMSDRAARKLGIGGEVICTVS